MRYIPHTQAEIREMLEVIGVASVDALFDVVPEKGRLRRELAIESAMDEVTLSSHLETLANKNDATRALSFLGAGIYDHHVPAMVDQMLTRGEWLTAYTPYQPEVSQGTLQAIFEFQTIVSELLGLPIANASMYDGASALAEAALMARRLTKKNTVVASRAVHPEYREVVQTYLAGIDSAKYVEIPYGPDGLTDQAALAEALAAGDVACVLVGYPNIFGQVEDLRAISEKAHQHEALCVSATPETQALSILESPGALGVDIAVGEGQPLGIPPQLGGPGCGLFACRNTREMLQNIPGRLCGETVDAENKRGFVLTLSTREQHIRRDKATSNICTNHGLMALSITIRMCLLGKQGYVELGKLCLSKSEYLKAKLKAAGFSLLFDGPTFNEFAVRRRAGGKAAPALAALAARGILGGVDLGRFYPEHDDCMLIAVTEKHTREDLDRLVSELVSIG
ncbi:MAG: aminomethyl-transferring glycine dehydrogenase subunit GcvPA [Deltaproteobacteria bacterium]|nr:aminomethyl-transferring glycine dehydrogenase subunit GcvPA [Deltaproteobacteria bacterium]